MLLRDNTRDEHVNTLLDHSWYYCAIFPFCGGGKKKKKKKTTKKQTFYDWATTGIPVITLEILTAIRKS